MLSAGDIAAPMRQLASDERNGTNYSWRAQTANLSTSDWTDADLKEMLVDPYAGYRGDDTWQLPAVAPPTVEILRAVEQFTHWKKQGRSDKVTFIPVPWYVISTSKKTISLTLDRHAGLKQTGTGY